MSNLDLSAPGKSQSLYLPHEQKCERRKPTITSMINSSKSARKHLIREKRVTTMLEPELMSAHRRVALSISKKKGLRERVEYLRAPKALVLSNNIDDDDDKDIGETFYRYIPDLYLVSDEEAYFQACNKPMWKLVTIEVEETKWFCLNIIGKIMLTCNQDHNSVDCGTPFFPNDKAETQNKLCRTINTLQNDRCRSCNGKKQIMKPIYNRLQRISIAMKEHRHELLKLIRKYDNEVKRCDSAIAECRERLRKKETRSLTTYRAEDSLDVNDTSSNDNQGKITDLNLIQGGVWQRLDVKSSIPLLIGHRFHIIQRLKQIRGELCVIVQAVYELGAEQVQKFVRGHLVRLRIEEFKKAIWQKKMSAAAVQIQCRARGLLSKMLVRKKRKKLHEVKAILIQCRVRIMLACRRFHSLWDANHRKTINLAAAIVQRNIRLWRGRNYLDHLLQQRRSERRKMERQILTLLKNKACVCIQRVARGYFSKRKIKELKIELQLNDKLMMLADKFLTTGDLWMFLKRIDEDYKRYEKTINNIVERENVMASTFVSEPKLDNTSQVINNRWNDHEMAWKKYSNLMTETACRDKNERDKSRPSTINDSPIHEQMVPVIGPCKKIMTQSIPNRQLNNDKQNSRRLSMYFSPKSQMCSGKKHNKNVDNEKRLENLCFNLDSAQHNFIEHKSTQTEESFDVTVSGLEDISGRYLRREIPLGLNDSIQRLLQAVSIRYFILKDNQQVKPLGTSNNLAIRSSSFSIECLESQAFTFAKPIIEDFKKMGMTTIRELLPITKMELILRDSSRIKPDNASALFLKISREILTGLMKTEKMNYLSLRREYQKMKSQLNSNGFARKNKILDKQVKSESTHCMTKLSDNSIKYNFLGSIPEDLDTLPLGLWDDHEKSSKIASNTDYENDNGNKSSTRFLLKCNRGKALKEKECCDVLTPCIYTAGAIRAKENLRLDLQTKIDKDYASYIKISQNQENQILTSDIFHETIENQFVDSISNKTKKTHTTAKKKYTKPKPSRSWVIPYTKKIIAGANERFPAYRYFHEKSLVLTNIETELDGRHLYRHKKG